MTAFPKYERYKDSGVEWLGEVPEHWEVVPNRALLNEQREKVGKNAPDFLLLSLTLKGVIPRNMENPQGKFPAEFNTYTIVKPDDLVFCLFDIDETPRAVGHARHHGMITGAYNVYSPTEKINPGYLFYYYLFLDADKRLKPLYTGLRKTIQRGVFGSAKAPLPPKPEQDRIVAFLDQKTAEIDALIAKKQRQIELLDEQKAILINRAVTRGLNPNAKLKPSGIEWIGDIPEHWEVKKLKYLINIQAGYAFKSSAYSHKDTDIRLLRGINVNPSQINWNDAVYWPHDKLRDVSDFMLDSDDMVMGMDRPWVGAGVRIARITKTDLPALLLQRVARIRATGIEPDYLERTLTGSGFKAYFEPILTGVSVPHISPDQIACYVAAVPPKAEQIKICEFIKEAESLRDKTARAADAQIESLKSLRSTLIAHAVTGGIKV